MSEAESPTKKCRTGADGQQSSGNDSAVEETNASPAMDSSEPMTTSGGPHEDTPRVDIEAITSSSVAVTANVGKLLSITSSLISKAKQSSNTRPIAPKSRSEAQEVNPKYTKISIDAFRCSALNCSKVFLRECDHRQHWVSEHSRQDSASQRLKTSKTSSQETGSQVMAIDSSHALPQTTPSMPLSAINAIPKSPLYLIANQLVRPLSVPLVMPSAPTLAVSPICPTPMSAIPSHIVFTPKPLPPSAHKDMPAVTDPAVSPPKKRKNAVDKPLGEKTCIGQGHYLDRQVREVVINMKHFYEGVHPDHDLKTVIEFISQATKISWSSVNRIVEVYAKTGTVGAPKRTKVRKCSFQMVDAERDAIQQCLFRLKDQNRLQGVKSVYNEIRASKELSPCVRKCSVESFHTYFKKYGFRINENKIIDIKPSEAERERNACQRKTDSDEYGCDWPGCEKRFRSREHLIFHLRTHTNVKPFVCRFPKCQYRCATSSNFQKHFRVHNKTVHNSVLTDGHIDRVFE